MFTFDLISDLHIETWKDFDWTGQATSPLCVVAGDIAKDHDVLAETLKHLGHCYQGVFYIDGNEEHKNNWDDIGQNYVDIQNIAESTHNVVYLQNNVVIVNGVAILGTNGWWSWNFDLTIDVDQTQQWWLDRTFAPLYVPAVIDRLAENDAQYLMASIERLQRHRDVHKIVIVTHTVPIPALISHDVTLDGSYRHNCMGNSAMQNILSVDTEQKVSHWCFGHYHSPVDQIRNGVRYFNNCRGRGDTPYNKSVYYPLRVEIDI